MNCLLEIVDNAALVYVLPSAFFIVKLGEAVEQNHPALRFWQHATGSLVFIVLVLRRFWFESPTDIPSSADALIRAGAFACISLGFAGVVGYAFLALLFVWREIAYRLPNWKSLWLNWRRRRRQYTNFTSPATAPPTIEQLRQDRIEQETRKKKAEERAREQAEKAAQRKAEARKRRSLRLNAKIALETTLDDSLRQNMKDWLNEFANDGLPIDEVEEQLEVMHDLMSKYKSQPKQFCSVAEILAHYEDEKRQLDETSLPQPELEQLHALLAMEQQIAVQEFSQR